jgi:drug/metabolite transporter (DMT)-like permease
MTRLRVRPGNRDPGGPSESPLATAPRAAGVVRPLGWGGIGLVVLVCAAWGANTSFIKISNQGIPPLYTASVRNLVAAIILAAIMIVCGMTIVHRDRRFWRGLVFALFFGSSFLLFYGGTAYTTASRTVLFLYTQPLWTALMAHFLLHGERLNRRKLLGLGVAFGGLALAFSFRGSGPGGTHLVGDVMVLGGGLVWGASIIYYRRTLDHHVFTAASALFYQLFFSVPVLLVGAWLIDPHPVVHVTGAVAMSLVYQTFVGALASYLLWNWLLAQYAVSGLASFTLLTPLFGLLAAWLILGESVEAALLVSLVLVMAGLYLVTGPSRRGRGPRLLAPGAAVMPEPSATRPRGRAR